METCWIGLLVAGMVPATTLADTLRVPEDHPTIQAAIEEAEDGDDVLVAAGTYVELIDTRGKAITVHSVGGAEVTTIDGKLAGSVVTCAAGEGPDTVVSGFTITGGAAEDGGGMHIFEASPASSGENLKMSWSQRFDLVDGKNTKKPGRAK